MFKRFSTRLKVIESKRYLTCILKIKDLYKNNTKILDGIIKDNCVFFKRDIKNDQIPTEIDVRFDKPKVYDRFKKLRIYEDYVADNSSKLFVTCRKICSGFINDYVVDDQKINWLKDFCEDLSFPLVIFYNFNCERDRIVRLMQDLKIVS